MARTDDLVAVDFAARQIAAVVDAGGLDRAVVTAAEVEHRHGHAVDVHESGGAREPS